jgi:DNA anti-recombination protein RmuC
LREQRGPIQYYVFRNLPSTPWFPDDPQITHILNSRTHFEGLLMPDRIPLDRAEFEAFLAENRALVERSLKLLERIDTLEKLNKQLEEELKKTKERLSTVETELNAGQHQASESLREARDTIGRLLKETEKRVTH